MIQFKDRTRKEIIEIADECKRDGIFVNTFRTDLSRGLYFLFKPKPTNLFVSPENFPEKQDSWCCSFNSAYDGYSRQLFELSSFLYSFSISHVYLVGHRLVLPDELKRVSLDAGNIDDIIFRGKFREDLNYDACKALECFVIREIARTHSNVHILNLEMQKEEEISSGDVLYG